jgi:hypothetical protein
MATCRGKGTGKFYNYLIFNIININIFENNSGCLLEYNSDCGLGGSHCSFWGRQGHFLYRRASATHRDEMPCLVILPE